ncbi:MAG: orotidine-5'-phosphate decarboxylase [Elusimicrobiota bacterium]
MKKLIVALDMQDKNKALAMVDKISPWVDMFKIGPILFLQNGPELLRMIKLRRKEVFLDLKFYDIPATVKRAVESACEMGVYSLTLHSSGGEEMLKAAAQVSQRPKLWAVTILTSQHASVEDVVERAKLAKSCGLDGVIASPLEIKAIKEACGADFTVVTPGIRTDGAKDDQKRTATPVEAVTAGADFIVVGRPVIEAKDPIAAARKILEEIEVKQEGRRKIEEGR